MIYIYTNTIIYMNIEVFIIINFEVAYAYPLTSRSMEFGFETALV